MIKSTKNFVWVKLLIVCESGHDMCTERWGPGWWTGRLRAPDATILMLYLLFSFLIFGDFCEKEIRSAFKHWMEAREEKADHAEDTWQICWLKLWVW